MTDVCMVNCDIDFRTIAKTGDILVTGWRLRWDVRRSKVVVTEKDGAS